MKTVARASAWTRALPTATKSSARPVLPPPKTMPIENRYALKYIDLPPLGQARDEKKPTFVFLHGAPGSFHDFKYIIPLLQDKARVIAVNLPGNGDSKVLDHNNYYDHIEAKNIYDSAYKALTQLCGKDEEVFVLGHSFGGHATLNLTATNEEKRELNIRGMALLASAGLRPHKALQPRTNAVVWALLRSGVSFVEKATQEVIKLLYTKVLRFPDNAPTEHYVAGIVRCATTDFRVVKKQVERVRHVPAFFAWAKDDAFMEEDIFLELSDATHPGPRIAFDKGGHNIQKTKAPILAEELLDWARQVMNGD